VSTLVTTIPTARWNIYQCAAWIETRDLVEVGRAHTRKAARETIQQIELAWRAGEIVPSGEVDGAPRRPLTAEDASDYSIDLYTREGVVFGGTKIFRHLHQVFPDLYAPGELLPEDQCHVVIRSLNIYPEQVVHDREGAITAAPGTKSRLRHRFIQRLSFDRNEVIKKWRCQDGDDVGPLQVGSAAADDLISRSKRSVRSRSRRGAKGRDFDQFMNEATRLRTENPDLVQEDIAHQLAKLWFDKTHPDAVAQGESYSAADLTSARRWVCRNFFGD
jgi:hypothetical protein